MSPVAVEFSEQSGRLAEKVITQNEGKSVMRLKSIVSYPQILFAILILAELTACGKQQHEPAPANASNPPEKQTRLADKVKDALKDNIFLKPEGLKVIVIDEKDGFVKLSVIKGSRRLREFLAAGTDLDSGLGAAEMMNSDGQQGWTALKKTVDYIKTIDGVKAVLVTAETNAELDQAEPPWIASSATMTSVPAGGDAKAISWKVANERWVQNTYANGDVTMSDKDTGRMWLYSANPCGKKGWSDAVAYCDNLTYAGYSDWRLPDKDTLEAQFSQKSYFDDILYNYYWTGTSCADDTSYAYHVLMTCGGVYREKKIGYLSGRYVWPVRGGQ